MSWPKVQSRERVKGKRVILTVGGVDWEFIPDLHGDIRDEEGRLIRPSNLRRLERKRLEKGVRYVLAARTDEGWLYTPTNSETALRFNDDGEIVESSWDRRTFIVPFRREPAYHEPPRIYVSYVAPYHAQRTPAQRRRAALGTKHSPYRGKEGECRELVRVLWEGWGGKGAAPTVRLKGVRRGAARFKTWRITMPLWPWERGEEYAKCYLAHEVVHFLIYQRKGNVRHPRVFMDLEDEVLKEMGYRIDRKRVYIKVLYRLSDGAVVWESEVSKTQKQSGAEVSSIKF